MDAEAIRDLAKSALEDLKGIDLAEVDVRGKSGVTDFMLVCSGTSERHVKSLANNVAETLKKAGERPLGVEGDSAGDWVLVDLGEVLVHVMLPETRQYYDLERLWSVSPERRPLRNED